MSNIAKTYLGDSVYAEFDGFALELCTNNTGIKENIIILEPEVYSALVRFMNSNIQEQGEE